MVDDICLHMIQSIKPKKYWTKEKCQEIALLCETIKEFRIIYTSAYNVGIKNNWLDDICSHMNYSKNPNGYWTKEKCQNEALKYTTKIEFLKKSNNAYQSSIKNKWIDDICLHMIPIKNYWTKEKCQKEALKYNTKIEFVKKSKGAYKSAYRNNWLTDICIHMIKCK